MIKFPDRETTLIKPITSDYDGRQYWYPDVRGSLRITHSEIEQKVSQLSVKESEDGLFGLYLSPKFKAYLEGKKFSGLEWITNTYKPRYKAKPCGCSNYCYLKIKGLRAEPCVYPTEENINIPRQLKLLSSDGKGVFLWKSSVYTMKPENWLEAEN